MKSELSDISLVTQVAVFRNKRAFDQLVRKYQSPVRRFLLSLTLGNEALSDDLAQDTFLKAYVSITQFRGLSSFSTWLMRITYNVFYDYKRRCRDEAVADSNGAMHAASQLTAGEQARGDIAFDIHRAMAQLRDEERTCVTLQMIEGEPIEQIAKITGMPANTVKSHLRRGKEKLTVYLKQNGYDGNR